MIHSLNNPMIDTTYETEAATFAAMGLDERLLQALDTLGFTEPTPIQAEAIPHVLHSERDLIGLAQTGTGKTAAFSLPVLQQLDPALRHPQAIILTPTRELCLQIAEDLKRYTRFSDQLHSLPVYGGASMETQIKGLKRGAQIIVGTPGRVLDLIRRKALQLDHIRFLVLDEADEMLDMGFRDDLDAILSTTPETRQTLLFSATMPDEIVRMVHRYMHDPYTLQVGKQNSGAETITHQYFVVPEKHRYTALQRLADAHPDIFAIVFCRTRQETRDVAEQLIRDGYRADALHGDLTQAQRDRVMKRFRNRNLQLLVATDVAARGLDVRDVTHVINYNLPEDNESYTHRSGRTGRAGKEGVSIAILTPREHFRIRQLEKQSGIAFEHCEIPGFDAVAGQQVEALAERITAPQPALPEALLPYLAQLEEKLQDLSKEELIYRLGYESLAQLQERFRGGDDINVSPKSKPERKGDSRNGNGGGGDYTKFFINLGGRDQFTKGDLISLVNREKSLRKADIGKIDILKNYSFFEVETRYEDQVLAGLNGLEYEGASVSVERKGPGDGGRRNDRKGGRKKRFK